VTELVVGEDTPTPSADNHEAAAVAAVAARMKVEADHMLRTMAFQGEHRLLLPLREQMPSTDCCSLAGRCSRCAVCRN